MVDSEDESNGTEDSQELTKIEREVVDLISIDSEEEDASDCSTDEDSSDDLDVGAKMNKQMKHIRY